MDDAMGKCIDGSVLQKKATQASLPPISSEQDAQKPPPELSQLRLHRRSTKHVLAVFPLLRVRPE